MLDIEIRNFQGVAHGRFVLEDIVLIAGVNAAGKSSLARAVGFTLTGHIPIAKKDAGKFVRLGASNGEIKISDSRDEHYCASLQFPSLDHNIAPNVPQVSPFAAGLVHLAELKDEERAKKLNELCKTDPTLEDLINEVIVASDTKEEEAKRKELATAAWAIVEAKGFEKACAQYEGINKEKKREWQRIAGTPYLPANAYTWLPKSWSTELQNTSEETLKGEIAAARQNLEALVGVQAVSVVKRADLEFEADKLMDGVLEQNAKLAAEKAGNAQREVREAAERLKGLSIKDVKEELAECPVCQQQVVVVDKKTLRKPADKMGKIELEALEKKRLEAQEDFDHKSQLYQAHQEEADSLGAELKEAKAAKQELAALEASNTPTEGPSEAQVEAARRAVEALEGKLEAYTKKRDADAIHTEIVRNALIVNALAEDGIKGKRTAQALYKLNENILAPLCKAAGWEKVEIGSDLSVRYNGLDYRYGPSTSEQFRARVTLQCAVAILDDSELLCIDAADVLDRDGRVGLMDLLAEVALPALVTMTAHSREEAPDLEEISLGKTYWLEDHKLEPLKVPATA